MKRPLPDAPHILVTGSSGAIGGAIARLVRERRPRARLTLVDRDGDASERLAVELGGDARALAVDLADVDALPAWLERAVGERGTVDGLSSCAGFMEVRRFESLPWDDAARLFAVDLLAPLRLMQLCVGGMLARGGGGFVVNVSSMAGRVPLKGCAFYGAAKAGLAMASEIARGELGPRGIHVVTVYPGPVASALERGARAQYGDGPIARAVPTGRPDELARRILDAVERRHARVIYPAVYSLGWLATNTAARFALAAGPDPSA
jgi:short-subunit dehydrogenase